MPNLITRYRCSECGHASRKFGDFVSDTPEVLTDGRGRDYIKRNRTTQCPECEAIL